MKNIYIFKILFVFSLIFSASLSFASGDIAQISINPVGDVNVNAVKQLRFTYANYEESSISIGAIDGTFECYVIDGDPDVVPAPSQYIDIDTSVVGTYDLKAIFYFNSDCTDESYQHIFENFEVVVPYDYFSTLGVCDSLVVCYHDWLIVQLVIIFLLALIAFGLFITPLFNNNSRMF